MTRRYSFIYFLIIIFMVTGCKKISHRQMFGNMTYIVNFYPETATLKDGEHDEPYLYVYLEEQVAYGDFNYDGRKDAVVILSVSGGGSGRFYRLAFLINNGKEYVNKQTYSLGDRVIVKSLKAVGSKVIADMIIHGPRDCMAGPTKHVKNEYCYIL